MVHLYHCGRSMVFGSGAVRAMRARPWAQQLGAPALQAAVRQCVPHRSGHPVQIATLVTEGGNTRAKFDPTGPGVLSEVPTWELVRGAAIFSICSVQWLIGPLIRILRSDSPLTLPLTAISRATVFPHFCAGETLESCRAVGARYRRRGVTMLVDHSVEESESDDALAGNLANKIRLLERVAAEVEGAAFVPVKITAVVSPALLEEMTAVIAAHPEHRRSVVNPEGSLSAPAIGALRRAEENLRALCGAAARLGIPVLLDAEQSHRQDAIDHLARGVMREFNRDGKAVVYNTYQMYMTGAGERVSRDLEVAAEHGYCFAAKIVRGAYLVSEAEQAERTGNPYPLQPSKADTDAAYDEAVRVVLERIGSDETAAAVMVATHNTPSVAGAVAVMESVGLAPDCPQVHFAQVMGMCDHLAAALGKAGFNTHKLVLFGAFHELFPWLLRRLDENRDLLGAAQSDRRLLVAEVVRRSLLKAPSRGG